MKKLCGHETPLGLFMGLAHRMKFNNDRALAEKGVGVQQAIMLIYLSKNDGVRQKDISAFLHTKESSVTSMLGNMEKSGLIERTVGEDARSRIVTLTDRARKLERQLALDASKAEERFFTDFTEEEKQTFVNMLKRIERNMFSEEDENV